MRLARRESIIATVCYRDIFDYPLTRAEVSAWAIGSRGEVTDRLIRQCGLFSVAAFEKRFVLLPGRELLIQKREERARLSKKKRAYVALIARLLRHVPSIQLVGITGGLAMDNAQKRDDIDILCIARSGTLWMSRAIVYILLSILRMRRKPGQANVEDAICPNMFLSEESLSLDVAERDLYAAHELLQMNVVWSRGDSYKRLLAANTWAEEYLPHIWEKRIHESRASDTTRGSPGGCGRLIVGLFRILEQASRLFQLWYMRKRKTTEVVRKDRIRFHPRDVRQWVRRAFDERLRRYNIPLDKVFYAGYNSSHF